MSGFSAEVLEELLRTGPFHTALRLTIHARGLSLERLHDRLARRGHRVSVSTLSNWQRGTSRPEHARSREALTVLEELLDVPPNALAALLGPRRPRLPRGDAKQGMSAAASNRIREELGGTAITPAAPSTLLSVHSRYVLGPHPDDWSEELRLVVEANQSGVDRHIAMFHVHGDTFPEITTGPSCRLGRIREENKTGLQAAELLFDRPLLRGETYPVEYTLRCRDDSDTCYVGWWFRYPGVAYDIALRFDSEVAPVACHRIWRLDPSTPHKDVGDLRLINGRTAHFYDPELEPGFHGIRWVWPEGD
ncbi:MAG: hypothetical protein ACRDT4_07380 [Micromonosporaceae bacterium]